MRFNRLALGAAAVLGLCSVPGEYHCAMSVVVLVFVLLDPLARRQWWVTVGTSDGSYFVSSFVFDDDNK